MKPLVSICLPTLNTLPYLQERFDSVLQQTFQDWELFVYDSHSSDGSWEFIEDIAKRDPRIRAVQGPREGPYPAWNACLQQTGGEYVYIATSDDSMSPNLLEKMVAALNEHADCELAHCPVVIVDQHGQSLKDQPWPECTIFADGIPEIIRSPHIRRAPYDGLTQVTGRQVVLSITQLLIRRSIFSRVGNFSNRWGSVSDFHWEMKAGLVANTVYVPDTWATWRFRPMQSTASVNFFSAEHARNIEEMIQDAVLTCERHLPSDVVKHLRSNLLSRARDLREYYLDLRERRDGLLGRRAFQVGRMFMGTRAVRHEMRSRIFGGPKWTDNAATEIRTWLESLGLQPLTPCPPSIARTELRCSKPSL